MSNLIKKTILAGLSIASLAAVSLTKNKVSKLVKDLVKKAGVTENEGVKLTKDLLKKAEKNKKDLEKHIGKIVRTVLVKLKVPARKEITDLGKKIENLNKKISKK